MELNKFLIRNFRSIKDETLLLQNNCIILLGKNEAGKSNILKAIASVFGSYIVSDKDKRKRIDNEKIDKYEVIAAFNLESSDYMTVLQKLKKKYYNIEAIKFTNGKTVEDYIKSKFKQFLRAIDIGNGKEPYSTYWSISGDYSFEKIMYVRDNTLTTDSISATPFNLNSEILALLNTIYLENPYKCNYWQYQDNYLLPNTVSIESFMTDPSSIKGLENIFILCGRENIKKEFTEAKKQDGDYSNLLEQVSKQISITFQNIWKDFKGTNIQIQPNGEEILIKVTNKAKYSFEDRSDGFKKFISILLMLSTQSRSYKIKEKDIILIDEPDQSLYPTSAQYLRDELLEISKKSKIIYSTHSQYMIDSNCIERHIVVEKNDDITTLNTQDFNSPFSDDELLRRAIGSSIFECLKPKNIIFEGYLDRELFRKYCNYYKKNADFKDYGTVYLSGISGAETLAQLLILANKKFIIVADSDETSKNKKADFYKGYPEHKPFWLSYGEVCKDITTMEDFFTSSFIYEELRKINSEFVYDEGKSAILNIEKIVNKDKEKKQDVKNALLKVAKKEAIKKDYGIYIEMLKEKLELL